MSSGQPAKKPLKVQPKNHGRRSKEERDALIKEENEREKARRRADAAESAAEAARLRATYGDSASSTRGKDWAKHGGGSYRQGGSGRGGYMSARGGGRGGAPTGSTRSGETKVEESPSNAQRRAPIKRDGESLYQSSGSHRIKTEPREHANNTDTFDEYTGALRKNIEQINISSDDEADDDQEQDNNTRGQSSAGPARRRNPAFVPVRLMRKEHVDRVVGINTDASSTTVAEHRKKNEENKGQKAGQGVFGSRKGKSKPKDVEFQGSTRKFRGVYDDDTDDAPIEIKKEPGTTEIPEKGDVPMNDETTLPATASETLENAGEDPQITEESALPKDEQERQPKKAFKRPRKPQFQTDEEAREWAIEREELSALQAELGQISPNPTKDDDALEPAESTAPVRNAKDDNVYLFQLPPVLPDLAIPEHRVKNEPQSPQISRASGTVTADSTDNPATPVKIDDDSNEIRDEPDVVPEESISQGPKLASGKVGRLVVHKSGRTTLSWGGTSFEVKMGTEAFFLQTAVLANLNVHKEGSAERSGEAMSLGQIRGKFVVTPDWNELLNVR